jgi:hypothetical protein
MPNPDGNTFVQNGALQRSPSNLAYSRSVVTHSQPDSIATQASPGTPNGSGSSHEMSTQEH